MIAHLAPVLFGPEYEGAKDQLIGTFDVSNTITDVILEENALIISVLPPGGYVLRYISGAFLKHDVSPTKMVVGGKDGAAVRWMDHTASEWTSVDYFDVVPNENVDYLPPPEMSQLFCLEFTSPHRLQLCPPEGVSGKIRIRVWHYKPETINGRLTD